MKQIHFFNIIFLFFGSLIILFIIIPIVSLFTSSSFNSLFQSITDIEILESIWLTLWTSMLASLIFAFLSTPLAYLLARRRFKGKSIIIGIIHVPLVIPHTAAGIALLTVLSDQTFLGRIAFQLGIQITGTPMAIMLAMAFVSLPFYIISAINTFTAVPEKYEAAALNLGASKWKVFFRISLPMAYRGLLYGIMSMWARGMSEFGAVVMLAYFPMIAPILIYHRFTSYGLQFALPPTILMIIISLIFIVLLHSLSKKTK